MANGKKAAVKSRSRPLASEAGLQRAIRRMDNLLDQGDSLSREEENELELLSNLVRAYEQKHFPVAPFGNREILAYLLEMKGTSLRQLANATRIPFENWSKINDGTESMSTQEIEKAAKYFRVKPSLFSANEKR